MNPTNEKDCCAKDVEIADKATSTSETGSSSSCSCSSGSNSSSIASQEGIVRDSISLKVNTVCYVCKVICTDTCPNCHHVAYCSAACLQADAHAHEAFCALSRSAVVDMTNNDM